MKRSRQQDGLEAGLGSIVGWVQWSLGALLFPQGLSTGTPAYVIPRLPLGIWAHRHMTLPESRAQGCGTRVEYNVAVEKGEPGPGWEQML